MNIKAVLFDLDGVLVDAVDIHEQAFLAAYYAATGQTISREEHRNCFNGLPTRTKLDILCDQNRIHNDEISIASKVKDSITKILIDERIKEDPRKIQLVQTLKAAGIKIACVTNCSQDTATMMLGRTGILRYINVLIHNTSVVAPKPSPDGFLKAMELFGLMAEDCLVVEDSPKGVQAGNASGAKVLVVSGPYEVTWENLVKHL